MPKSIILMEPSASSMMFWGLTSRWTMPLAWACSSAARIWVAKCTVSFQVRAPPRCLRYSFSVMPSIYSMTMYCILSDTETSYTLTMLGWLRMEMALDSFLKRRTSSSLSINSSFRTLTATALPVWVSLPR